MYIKKINMKNNKKPVFLNLFLLHLPITGLVSILHRISGVLVFILFPFLILGLHLTLIGDIYCINLKIFLESVLFKLLLWLTLSSLLFHILAGIKHLIMDIGFGVSLNSSKILSSLTLILFILLAILLGTKIW